MLCVRGALGMVPLGTDLPESDMNTLGLPYSCLY